MCLAAKRATTEIPIVFSIGTDPVEVGLVPSLNKPGSNLTGVYQFTVGLESKRLGLLHEMVPKVDVIGVLVNPNYGTMDACAAAERAVCRSKALAVALLSLLYEAVENVDEIARNLSRFDAATVMWWKTAERAYPFLHGCSVKSKIQTADLIKINTISLRIAMLTAKLKLLDEPLHTL
jgi:ABC-type uncharacterized transport system substrate-binding protein